MTEIAEKNARKLTPFDRRKLMRELAVADRKRGDIARSYGVTAGYITQFAKQHARQIEEIRADIDNEFAGLWIASKEQRLAAYEREYDTSENGDYGSHYEHVRTRTQILRNVAEELGQLPTRATTAIITPVVHIVENVSLDDLK